MGRESRSVFTLPLAILVRSFASITSVAMSFLRNLLFFMDCDCKYKISYRKYISASLWSSYVSFI